MGSADFWGNQDTAQKVIKEMKGQRAAIEPLLAVEAMMSDVQTMYELGREANDTAALDEADHMLYKAEHAFEKVELQALFTGPHDRTWLVACRTVS